MQPGRSPTSPWNYLSEAQAALAFPDRVRFHYVTLRDGEQQARAALIKEDKEAVVTDGTDRRLLLDVLWTLPKPAFYLPGAAASMRPSA